MHSAINKFVRPFFVIAALTAAAVPARLAYAQAPKSAETDIKITQKLNIRRHGHWGNREASSVIDEQTFKDLLTQKENAALQYLKIDFSTQTLFVVTVRGDCFVRSSVTLTRDDAAKKYLCRVTKIYGGCRAAGTMQSWIVIDKIPPEYRLEFIAMTPIAES